PLLRALLRRRPPRLARQLDLHTPEHRARNVPQLVRARHPPALRRCALRVLSCPSPQIAIHYPGLPAQKGEPMSCYLAHASRARKWLWMTLNTLAIAAAMTSCDNRSAEDTGVDAGGQPDAGPDDGEVDADVPTEC